MKTFFVILFLLVSGTGIAGKQDFSGWMKKRDLDSYFEILNKGDTESPYFDKGHWIRTVENRWNGYELEYRVTIADSPDAPFHLSNGGGGLTRGALTLPQK